MSILSFHELTKMYGKARGMENITFSVEKGEIVGFIGPNGAGKSTTIRTLLNFLHATSGKAEIFGLDSAQHHVELKKRIGYLPSEVHFYEDLTVKEMLKFSAGFYSHDSLTHALTLADRLKLDTTRKVEDLSFGNKKKVGIVLAMMHEPELLVLDEPTSGLDPLMQSTFFELLKEARDKGTTIFFSSHYLNEVQKLCNRVVIIKEGKIAAIESMDNMRKDTVKKVTLHSHEKELHVQSLPGMIEQHKSDTSMSFLYKGNVKDLMLSLHEVEFDDITVEDPSLEEVFMHYYKEDDSNGL
ncbi:ABC transporter ATP-binding protein [Paenisporosarcina cavernae]|uniref:ABC transporter ATP-binding protein n=1 Tax=Paenisporosarcina cavernae TaxID=2320858 RepID=A0A385YU97_9BACL|nr:ABC transporter ATP-binding protein [Paenisporosarcina cavernae]AYC30439.1 ABC transporter ATP-binding protein [Paenisporosarcina cavernae]